MNNPVGGPVTQVKTIMSKNLKTILSGATLQEAYAMMEEHRIRHLPVVNDEGTILGVLSYKNIITNKSVLIMPVDFFIASRIIEIHQDTPIKTAVFRMLEEKISSLLITNDNQEAVGIVTTDDLLWQLATHLKSEPENETESPFLVSKGAQTIGEIANLLSQVGI